MLQLARLAAQGGKKLACVAWRLAGKGQGVGAGQVAAPKAAAARRAAPRRGLRHTWWPVHAQPRAPGRSPFRRATTGGEALAARITHPVGTDIGPHHHPPACVCVCLLPPSRHAPLTVGRAPASPTAPRADVPLQSAAGRRPRAQGQHHGLQHARLQGRGRPAALRPLGASVGGPPPPPVPAAAGRGEPLTGVFGLAQRRLALHGPLFALEPLPRHAARPRHGHGRLCRLLRVRAFLCRQWAPRRGAPLRGRGRRGRGQDGHLSRRRNEASHIDAHWRPYVATLDSQNHQCSHTSLSKQPM